MWRLRSPWPDPFLETPENRAIPLEISYSRSISRSTRCARTPNLKRFLALLGADHRLRSDPKSIFGRASLGRKGDTQDRTRSSHAREPATKRNSQLVLEVWH